jgi:hypothetical protein
MTSRSITSQIAHRTGRSTPSGILARLGFGAFAGSFAADELASADGYGALLARSGGKFTDSLERDADLRLRGNSGGF